MNGVNIRVKLLTPTAVLPSRAHPNDAGWDISASRDIWLPPRQIRKVPTDIVLDIPTGWEIQIRPRSGMAAKHGVTVLNTPATIDAGYQGAIIVLLINHGDNALQITPGMRIAQLVVQKVSDVLFEVMEPEETLEVTERGTNGCGSSGL